VLEFYRSQIRKAKKSHICSLCDLEIQSGEKYQYQCGKYDEVFFSRALHLYCDNILQKFSVEYNDHEYTPEWVADWLEDKYCFDCENEEICQKKVFQCTKILNNFM